MGSLSKCLYYIFIPNAWHRPHWGRTQLPRGSDTPSGNDLSARSPHPRVQGWSCSLLCCGLHAWPPCRPDAVTGIICGTSLHTPDLLPGPGSGQVRSPLSGEETAVPGSCGTCPVLSDACDQGWTQPRSPGSLACFLPPPLVFFHGQDEGGRVSLRARCPRSALRDRTGLDWSGQMSAAHSAAALGQALSCPWVQGGATNFGPG